MEYILVNSLELFMLQWIRCFFKLSIIYIVFCFDDFLAVVCIYVADMISYYFVTFFNITIKTNIYIQ
jgi:hypothetical protein